MIKRLPTLAKSEWASTLIRNSGYKPFFMMTFSVLGHVAKTDGRVSADEIEIARTVTASLGLNPELRRAA